MQNQPTQPNTWPQFSEYGAPQVEHAAQMELVSPSLHTPPKPGYKTTSFWILVAVGLGLGGLVVWGKLTSDQAIAIGNQIGVWSGLGLSGGGLLSLAALVNQYLKARGQVAVTRQHFFGEIKKVEAQNASLPPLDNSALLQQQIDYLQAQLRAAQNRP